MNADQNTIYRYLVDQLIVGRLGVGDRLPTENELGARFGTSRMNAHFAINQLHKRGIVDRKKRVGTEVIKEITPALARDLRGETTRRICVINRNDDDYGYIHWNKATVEGLEPALITNKIEISYRDFTDVNSREALNTRLHDVSREGFSGLVLLVGNRPEDCVFTENQDLLFQYFKHVFVYLRDSSQQHQFPFHTVSISNFHEGALAVEFLLEKGYRDVLFYSPQADYHTWSSERLKGVRAGMLRLTEGEGFVHAVFGLNELTGTLRESNRSWSIIVDNDRNAAAMIDALTRSPDEGDMSIVAESIDNGQKFSVDIGEGILQAIGAAVQQAQQALPAGQF